MSNISARMLIFLANISNVLANAKSLFFEAENTSDLKEKDVIFGIVFPLLFLLLPPDGIHLYGHYSVWQCEYFLTPKWCHYRPS